MVLFSIDGEELKKVHRLDFRLERDIQNVTEHNMDIIFGLDFVKSEFQLNNLRIDSLAYDEETNSFVIIELKGIKILALLIRGMHILLCF
jgi:RecB family endonuclease NucS